MFTKKYIHVLLSIHFNSFQQGDVKTDVVGGKKRQFYAVVQAEIEREVGRSRLPCLADRDRLPYTAAVLLEVLRCGNIVPQGVHHMPAR
jgi:hypothetical protein